MEARGGCLAGHNSDGERCIHRPSQNTARWKGPTRPIPVQLPGQKLCRALCCPGQKPAWVSFQKALTRGSWPRAEGREGRAHTALFFPCWHRAQGRLKPFPSRRTQRYERAAPSPFSPRSSRGSPAPPVRRLGPGRPPPLPGPYSPRAAAASHRHPGAALRKEGEAGNAPQAPGGRPAVPGSAAGPGALLLPLRERGAAAPQAGPGSPARRERSAAAAAPAPTELRLRTARAALGAGLAWGLVS